jgi:hypothetical protein
VAEDVVGELESKCAMCCVLTCPSRVALSRDCVSLAAGEFVLLL